MLFALAVLCLANPTSSPGAGFQIPPQIPLRAPDKPCVDTYFDAAGGGPRSVEYRIDLTYTLEDSGPAPVGMDHYAHCTFQCRGNKHREHSECDSSCDIACLKFHWSYGEPARVRYLDPDSSVEGEKLAYNGLSFVGLTRQTFKVAKDMRYEEIVRYPPPGHWAAPCSSSGREYQYKRFKLRAKGTVKHFVHNWDTFWTTMDVDHVVAYIDLLDLATPPKEVVFTNCFCTGQTGLLEPETASYCAGPQSETGTGTGFVPAELGLLGLGVVGQSLTNVGLTAAQLPTSPFRLFVPAGCPLKSEDPKVQDMVTLVGQMLTIPAKESPFRGPSMEESFDISVGKLRVACTQIAKKEPDETTRFKIGRIEDPALARLAEITNKSRFRGPHDQARIWIYTDQASLAEINKVMLPGVTPGRYASLLHEMHEQGRISMLQPRFRKCFTNDLLLGTGISPDALKWLFARLRGFDAKGLGAFIRDNYAKFAVVGKEDDPETITYLATVLDCILLSPDKELYSLATAFADKAVPASLCSKIFERSQYGARMKLLIRSSAR